MSEDTQPLVGDVKSVFKYGKPEDFAAAVQETQAEQEAMCGYRLVLKGTRQTHQKDSAGNDVYEVYATFGPAPAPPPPIPKSEPLPVEMWKPPLDGTR